MPSLAAQFAAVALAVGALGCSGGGALRPDARPGTSDGAPEVAAGPDADAGGEADAGSESDAAAEAPAPVFTGRHSYIVTAGADTFTLALDGDAHIAMAASPQGRGEGTLTRKDATTLQVTGSFHFNFSGGCPSGVAYDTMTLVPARDGSLTGTAMGQVVSGSSDIAHVTPVTVTLAGRPDDEPPALNVNDRDDATDPFRQAELVASEPLPPGTMLTLSSSTGDEIPLVAGPGAAVTSFQRPNVLLRFGESYSIPAAQVVDFAGNKAQTSFQFTTHPPPPLLPEDGFESATGPMVGGAQLIAGQTNPVIAGDKSLYIAPGTPGGPKWLVSQLLVRLAVSPGDTVVRFSYRTVDAQSGPSGGLRVTYGVGAVGKPVEVTELKPITEPKTAFTPLNSSTVYLGPLNVAELPLPAGTADEVFLDRRTLSGTPCGAPPPPTTGVIIDDLRVE